jgi:hypothetical protein
VTYPIAPLGVRMRAAIGIYDPSTDPSTWPWQDITLDVDHLVPISDEIGSTDDDSEPSTTLSFALKNDLSRIATTVVGRYTTDNPESDLYPFFDVGCPIEYALDVGDGGGYDIQCIAFLETSENDWPSNTQYRSIARISCVGELQRGGVLNQTQRSPMYRTIMDRRNLGVWMFEDAQGSTRGASALATQADMVPYESWAAFTFGDEALVPGVSGGATIGTGQAMAATLKRTNTAAGVRVGFLMFAGTNPAAQAELVSISNTLRWRFGVEIGPSNLRFRAYNPAGTEVSGAALAGFTDHLAGPVFCEMDVVQSNATTIAWTVRETKWSINSAGAASPSTSFVAGTFAGTLGTLDRAGFAIFGNVDDVHISAVALTEQTFPASGGFSAVLGWAGNTAAGRVQGMCNELGVASSVTSTALGAVMGPQLIDTLRANLLDVQHTDHGVLSDHLGKVTYRALSELYDLAPAFTLTRAVRGQLGKIPAKRDDTAKTNRVTVTRAGGGSATTEDAFDILRKGLYETAPPDVNVAIDDQLLPQAGWYLARGVALGYRYDEMTMNMRVAGEYTPTLPGLVTTLQLGDRIAISSLPPQSAKGGIERQVRGRKQSVTNRGMLQWEITYAMVPVDAYEAFVLNVDRLDTAGTEVLLAATTTDTLIMTATAGAQPDATSLGASLDMAGEQVTLTAVVPETPTDTFTRTVSNGWGSMPATTHVPAQAYTPTVSTTDYAATGTTGTMVVTSAPASRTMYLLGLPMLNPDFTAIVQIPVLATGGNLEFQVNTRYILAANSSYAWRVTIDTAAKVRLLGYVPGGVDPIVDVDLSLTHTAGSIYGIRVAPINQLHRVKVWQGTALAEPDGWSVQVEDSTRLVPGAVAVRAGRAAGNTNASFTPAWDNLSFNNIQALTLTRSQGSGVVKTQAAGNSIKLWRGRGLAL